MKFLHCLTGKLYLFREKSIYAVRKELLRFATVKSSVRIILVTDILRSLNINLYFAIVSLVFHRFQHGF